MNPESNQLSLEQEFIHEVFATKIQDLSYKETKDLLIKFHKYMLFKDNFYKKLFHTSGPKELSNQQKTNNIEHIIKQKLDDD